MGKQIIDLLCKKSNVNNCELYGLSTMGGLVLDRHLTLSDYGLGSLFLTWQAQLFEINSFDNEIVLLLPFFPSLLFLIAFFLPPSLYSPFLLPPSPPLSIFPFPSVPSLSIFSLSLLSFLPRHSPFPFPPLFPFLSSPLFLSLLPLSPLSLLVSIALPLFPPYFSLFPYIPPFRILRLVLSQ